MPVALGLLARQPLRLAQREVVAFERIGDDQLRAVRGDALQMNFTELQLERDPGCRYCGDGRAFPGYIDYERFCASAVT